MKNPTHLVILLGLALATCGLTSPAAAQTCYGATCTITGTSGSDVLTGTSGPDVICGLGGNDTLSGGGGDDMICGGAGTDTLYGQGGSDVLLGQQNDDYLDGGSGSDWAQFEAAVTASLLSGTANDGLGIDTMVSIENLGGSSGIDNLIGDHSDNVLDGQGGDDYLTGFDGIDVLLGRGGNEQFMCGGNGADVLDGGPGSDTGCYYTAITVNLALGTASDGDTLTSVENLITSDQNDVLIGDGNANYFRSGGGADNLDGGGGTDVCDGDIPAGLEENDVCSTACETAISCFVF
jgi:Ca2+-binding RTX toxin-like protein